MHLPRADRPTVTGGLALSTEARSLKVKLRTTDQDRRTFSIGGATRFLFWLFASLFISSAWGQTADPQHTKAGDSEILLPGIAVEEVPTNLSSQKPVLQEGDILLSWWRGEVHGEFESPFSFWWLHAEQQPLGMVSVQGLRRGEAKTWVLGRNDYYARTRPNLTGTRLAQYKQAQELAKAGKVSRAAERWLAMARSFRAEHGWLPAWFSFQAGRILTDHHLSKQANKAYADAIRRAGDDLVLLAPIQRFWAANLWQGGELSKADEHYLKILPELQKAGRNLVASAFLKDLGASALVPHNFRLAREYALAALAIDQPVAPEGLGTARALEILGEAALGTGDLDESEKSSDSALKLYRQLAPDSRDVAVVLVDLAGVAIARADLVKAEKYLSEALLIETRIGDFSTEALMGLGWVADNRGDSTRAKEFWRRIVDFHKKQDPGNPSLGIGLSNLSQVYREEGDLAQAERCARQALLFEQRVAPQSIYTAGALGSLGEILAARGRVDEAEKYLLQSLALEEKLENFASWTADISERLRWLGDLNKRKRNFGKAKDYYSKAVTMLAKLSPEGTDYAESLAGLADVARLEGDLGAAAPYYEDALKALEGQTVRLGGSSELRASFRARHENVYREYIEVLLGLNKPELAFQALERSRARTLLETLAAAHVDVRKGVDPELISRERSLQASLKAKSQRRIHLLNNKHTEEELKAVEAEISNLTSDYEDVEAQVRSSSPVYAALTQPQPSSQAEIQKQLLDADTVLLEYSLGEERSHVFVVSADSLEVVELAKRSEIEAASRRVYELLTARNLRKKDESPATRQVRIARAEQEYPTAAVRLSRMVLGPIARQLTGKRLLMVSDGALHYVPFAALPVSVGGKAPAPLAAQHEIISLPSASVLAVLRRERMGPEPTTKTVAVLADPVFDTRDTRVKHPGAGTRRDGVAVRSIEGSPAAVEGSEESLAFAHLTRSASDVGWQGRRRGEVYLPRLRFSRQEADAIAAATPPGQALEALDFQASRATAMETNLANYRIVHFATHALLNSKHPELSGLVLSLVDERGRPRNGFLDLEDIYNLNLPAELVVLSACETGLGKEISGEGLVGLTRGFMYAGASRVMASLWKIDDRATAEFMGHFYQAMVGQRMRPAAALRAAQLRMRKDKRWRSPYFWAAFQIQGEWK